MVLLLKYSSMFAMTFSQIYIVPFRKLFMGFILLKNNPYSNIIHNMNRSIAFNRVGEEKKKELNFFI